MICVMDACAMIAYLAGEPGGETVRSLLLDSSNRCMAHSVNLCEVYYHFLKRADARAAKSAMRTLRAAGIRSRRDFGSPFWIGIATLKATCKASLGDCFAIQLARQLKGNVITSDHHEFDEIARRRICEVTFIR